MRLIQSCMPLGLDVSDTGSIRQDFDVVAADGADAVAHADLDQMSESLVHDARSNQRKAPIGRRKQLRKGKALTTTISYAQPPSGRLC